MLMYLLLLEIFFFSFFYLFFLLNPINTCIITSIYTHTHTYSQEKMCKNTYSYKWHEHNDAKCMNEADNDWEIYSRSGSTMYFFCTFIRYSDNIYRINKLINIPSRSKFILKAMPAYKINKFYMKICSCVVQCGLWTGGFIELFFKDLENRNATIEETRCCYDY